MFAYYSLVTTGKERRTCAKPYRLDAIVDVMKGATDDVIDDGYESMEEKQLDIIASNDEYKEDMRKWKDEHLSQGDDGVSTLISILFK